MAKSRKPRASAEDPQSNTGGETVRGTQGDEVSEQTFDFEKPNLSATFDASAGAEIGPYRLDRKIGEGGMGTVWLATHGHLDKQVALKLLPPHLVADSKRVARFSREMKAAGKVSHPNIVHAYDAGEVDGTHYLAIEYVDGYDLHEKVKKKGPLSVSQACRAIRQAALGLAAAHAEGLVHRDIKPSNLFAARSGSVKVLDLGLARLSEEAAVEASEAGLTVEGQVLGTPDYMSPEQWRDMRQVGPPADLYALGCTLFFLLTGRAPFSGQDYSTIARKMVGHVSETPPDLAEACPDAPPELCDIYNRLMAKTTDDRPDSAKELAEELKPFTSKTRGESNKKKQATISPEKTLGEGGDFSYDGSFEAGQTYGGTQPEVPLFETRRRRSKATPNNRKKKPNPIVLYGSIAGGAMALLVAVGLVVAFSGSGDSSASESETTIAQADAATANAADATPVAPASNESGTTPPSASEGDSGGNATPPSTGSSAEAPSPTQIASIPSRPVPLPPEQGEQNTAAPASAQAPPVGESPYLPGLVATPPNLPDGSRWQLETRKLRGEVICLDWSPDGKLIAVGTEAGNVRLLDPKSLDLVRILPHPGSSITDLEWSPTADRIAATTIRGELLLMEPGGKLLHRIRVAEDRATAVAWSHDGRRLAVGSRQPNILRLYTDTGELLGHTDTDYPLDDCTFLANGNIAAVHTGQTIQIFNDTLETVRQIHVSHKILNLARLADGRLLVGSYQGLSLFNPQTGSVSPLLESDGKTTISCLDMSVASDGRKLAVCGGHGVYVWPHGPDAPVTKKGTVHSNAIDWSPEGNRIVAASRIGRSYHLGVATLAGHVETSEDLGGPAEVKGVSITTDGKRIAVGLARGGPCGLIASPIGEVQSYLKYEDEDAARLIWSPDGKMLAARLGPGTGGYAALFQGTRQLWQSVDKGNDIRWSSDSRSLVIADFTARHAKVVGIDGSSRVIIPMTDHHDDVIDWSSLDEIAILIRNEIRIFRPDGTQIATLPNSSQHHDLKWSRDGKSIATGGSGVVTIRERDGVGSRTLRLDESAPAKTLAWSRSSSRIATATWCGNITVWDTEGTRVATFQHAGDISQEALDWFDDSRLLAGGKDGTLRLYNVDEQSVEWTCVLVPTVDGPARTLTVDTDGKFLASRGVNLGSELVYLVESPDGSLEVLNPSQFRRRASAN
ncbi:serine/threonine-protein kinase [Stratiformator vulcanicus]|nr:serine/threonine-protein kinase [Stratiformator vulcanicus]